MFKYFLCLFLNINIYSAVLKEETGLNSTDSIIIKELSDYFNKIISCKDKKEQIILLDLLKTKANNGDAQSQYEIGIMYELYIVDHTEDNLLEAEQWLLKARDNNFNQAYKALVNLMRISSNWKKYISYAQDAVKQGYLECNFHIGNGYFELKEYKEAYAYYEKTINYLQYCQESVYLKCIYEKTLYNISEMIKEGLGCDKDAVKFVKIMSYLSDRNLCEATYNLAVFHLRGLYGVTKNVCKYYELLEKIIKFNKSSIENLLYETALFECALYCESEKINDYKKAFEYYRQMTNVSGKISIWKLIATNRCPIKEIQEYFGAEQMFDIFKSYITYNTDPDSLAFYIYFNLLISRGLFEEALEVVELMGKRNIGKTPIIDLQLAIAYYYGFGVDKDIEKANSYFDSIDLYEDLYKSIYKSWDLVQGYRLIIGLGIEKNIKKGMALVNSSESKLDDIYLRVEDLFPIITRLKIETDNPLIANFLNKQNAPVRKKKNKKQAVSNKVLHKITIKEWNDKFKVEDGSIVTEINLEKKYIIIYDPKKNEQLTVKFKEQLVYDISLIKPMMFHKRIPLRKKQSPRVHEFAEMLDYVIQYIGESIPFMKSDRQDDQLLAEVCRKDLSTGSEIDCVAQYAFGKNEEFTYLYHRVLKPNK